MIDEVESSLRQSQEGCGVLLLSDGVLIEHHLIRQASIVSRFKVVNAEDRIAELDRILEAGSIVLNNASPLLDAANMRREMEAAAAGNAAAVKDTLVKALDPVTNHDGAFLQGLADVRTKLDVYLDPEKASNIYSAIEATVKGVVGRALDPDSETSPLGRALRRLVAGQEESQRKLLDLYGKVAGLVERRDERESSTRKGDDYQENVFMELARIASIHGDTFEESPFKVGDVKPARRGDGVVTVNPQLTEGVPIRLVFEAGDRARVSENAMLDELDGAKANRSALAAVAVLPSVELGVLKGRRVRVFDDARFVCVLDKATWDALPLELAYIWAKMAALRASSPDTVFEGVAMQVVSLVEKGLRQLDRVDSVRAQFKKATEGISSAEGVIIDTKAEVSATLNQAVSLLRAHEG